MFNRFYFRGFQPTRELEDTTETLLEELRNDGPSDGTFLGSIESVPDGYLARLDLYSMHGPFLADSNSHDAKEAIRAVIAKIRAQIARWREREGLRERTPLAVARARS